MNIMGLLMQKLHAIGYIMILNELTDRDVINIVVYTIKY